MMTVQIPYITIADLGRVLDDCCNRIGFIDDGSRQRILNLVTDYTAELIRKSQVNKDLNLLRQHCLDECADYYRTKRSAIRHRRAEINTLYKLDTINARTELEVGLSKIRQESHNRIAELSDKIRDLKDRMNGLPFDSNERSELRGEAHSLGALLNEEKNIREVDIREAYLKYSETLRKHKTKMVEDLTAVDDDFRDIRREQTALVKRILAADPVELQTILDEILNMKEVQA